MTQTRAEKILLTLRNAFTLPEWITSDKDSFKTLITTIISQNTADRNTARAIENLSRNHPITPEALANAETNRIEESLKVAGLYRNKAKTIKKVSKIILEEFHGDFDSVLSLPLEDARETLMQLPGVGPKTADVVLLFCASKPTIPIDTHVNRVSKRLGLAPTDGDYEAIRKSLQALFSSNDYLAIHILLITLGRRYCKAGKPLCIECPVNKLCLKKFLE
jgi:endonuclease-3